MLPVSQAEVERRFGALQREAAHMQAMQDPQADMNERMAKRQALLSVHPLPNILFIKRLETLFSF